MAVQREIYGIDAVGDEVFEGDPIILIGNEFVLKDNLMRFLAEEYGVVEEVAEIKKDRS